MRHEVVAKRAFKEFCKHVCLISIHVKVLCYLGMHMQRYVSLNILNCLFRFPFETGLILPSGEINWNCPCLGGMASGPCGAEFREAFSCFHYSQAEPKGSDCIEKFRDMQMCMSDYPEIYPPKEEDRDEDDEKREDEVKDDERIEEGAENNKTEDAKQTTLTDGTGEVGTTS